MSSNCLACTDPINACPVCPSGQSCVQTGRSCSACPKRICQDTGSSGSTKGGGGGGTSTAATAGGAVGGVVGVALVLAALYFFWWRPRGLAASRKRYSKHLVNRQSKVADSKRKSQLSPGGTTDAVAKRSSVHLHMDAAGGEGAVNRRNTSPGAAREGGALTPGRTSEVRTCLRHGGFQGAPADRVRDPRRTTTRLATRTARRLATLTTPTRSTRPSSRSARRTPT